jgi:5-methylcytosine-specific restriction endonuclease McrA
VYNKAYNIVLKNARSKEFMIEVDQEDFEDLRLEVSRMAKSEEDVRDILWSLARTDWETVFTNDLIHCEGCKQSIQYREAVYVHGSYRYCAECSQKEQSRSCDRCWARFSVCMFDRRCRCSLCFAGICEICKRAALPLEYTSHWPRVICRSCSQIIGLDGDWEYRELRKLSSHEQRAGGDVSLRQWVTTLQDFSWKCAYCESSPYKQLDHFIPVSKGGYHSSQNCVPACKPCNDAKGQRLPHEVTAIPREVLNRVELYLQGRE